MEQPDQLRRLRPYFLNRDPWDPPLDPAQLGDPGQYDGLRGAVAELQAGTSPDDVYQTLPQELKLVLAETGPDPAEQVRDQLRNRWRVMGIDELLTPPERPKYLIDGMVRRPGLVCVFGNPGDLKSMLLMDLAVSIAAGTPWLPPLPDVGTGGSYPITQGPVLWLDMDNGPNRLKERFGALCRARGVDMAPLHAVSLPRPVYDASKIEEADLLAAQLSELGAVACFVDNLGTISGGRDENSSEMVDVMANLRWVTDATGATLFVVHHARKGSAPGRQGDRLRGHSSIEASLDLALMMERQEDDVTLQSTKTRDDPVAPFVARWTFDKTGDGALDMARFWHIENLRPDLPEYAEVGQDLAQLLRDLDAPPNQTQLVKELMSRYNLSRKTALNAIKYAVSHAVIRELGGPGRTSPKSYQATVNP